MLRLTAVLLLVVTIGGCSDETESTGPATTHIRLALNWKPEPQFGGFYAAEVGGFYVKHGLDVDILPGGSGTPTIQMIAAKQVPFGIVSADELLIARARGQDVVALFAVYQTNPQGIMTRAERGFKEIGEVFTNPGILAMQRGLPYADFLVRKYPNAKVTIVPYSGGIDQFLLKKDFSQQCFVTSEPLLARKSRANPQTFLIAEAGYNPYTTVLATQREFLQSQPELARVMTAAVREGWRAYLDDPKPANTRMGSLNLAMDAQTFIDSAAAQKPLIETEETKAGGLGTMTEARWQTLGDQLKELGVIQAIPKASDCFAQLP